MKKTKEELVEMEIWLSQELQDALSAEATRLHCSENDVMCIAVNQKLIKDKLSDIEQEMEHTFQVQKYLERLDSVITVMNNFSA